LAPRSTVSDEQEVGQERQQAPLRVLADERREAPVAVAGREQYNVRAAPERDGGPRAGVLVGAVERLQEHRLELVVGVERERERLGAGRVGETAVARLAAV